MDGISHLLEEYSTIRNVVLLVGLVSRRPPLKKEAPLFKGRAARDYDGIGVLVEDIRMDYKVIMERYQSLHLERPVPGKVEVVLLRMGW